MKNHRACLFGSGLIISIILTLSCAFAVPHDNEQRLKVGAILPLSGDLSFVGTEIQRGMQLGMMDFSDGKIELLYEDDQSFAKTESVKAAKKLVEVDGISLLLNGAVNTANAIAPILQKRGVPGVVVWDNNRSIARMGGSVYSIGFSTELAGEDMAEFAKSKLGIHRVSVVSAHDEWSELIAAAFVSKFGAIGGSVITQQQVVDNETDLRATILKIIAKNPDAIYAPLNPPVIENLIRQARQLGFKGKLLVADGFGENEIKALGDLAEGVYVTQLWVEDSDLHSKYKAKFGEAVSPINMGFVGLGYDAIKMASALMKVIDSRQSVVTPKAVAEIIDGFRFTGVTGVSLLSNAVPATKREPVMIVRDRMFKAVS